MSNAPYDIAARLRAWALEQAIAGETGASAILTAPKVMTRLKAAEAERDENEKAIAVWRGRTQRAEAERDRLLKALGDIERITMSQCFNATSMAERMREIARAALKEPAHD